MITHAHANPRVNECECVSVCGIGEIEMGFVNWVIDSLASEDVIDLLAT